MVCEQAVRETAELAGSCFRRSDFLGRLGDAQFAALAVDAAEPSATVLRQRVESRLAISQAATHHDTALERQ
jgi:GGDEF domain-containing protein